MWDLISTLQFVSSPWRSCSLVETNTRNASAGELRVNNAVVSAVNRGAPRKTGALFVLQNSQCWHRVLLCGVLLSHWHYCQCGSLKTSKPTAFRTSTVPNGRCGSILTAPTSHMCPLVGPMSGGELECCCGAILHRYVGASVTLTLHPKLNMSPQLLDTELWARVAAWCPAGVKCGTVVMYGLGVMWHCGDVWVGCHVALW